MKLIKTTAAFLLGIAALSTFSSCTSDAKKVGGKTVANDSTKVAAKENLRTPVDTAKYDALMKKLANGDTTGKRQEASAKGSVTVVAPLAPKLLLVKRITAVNGVDTNALFVDDPGTTDDNDPNWPTSKDIYLRGVITGVSVKPGDRLEYTIYFLSAGNTDLSNINICDLIPPLTTFVNNAYDIVGGGSGLGMAFANSVTATPTSYLTNIADSDKGRFYPAGSTPNTTVPVVTVCNRPNTAIPLTINDNTDGLVVVEVVKRTTAIIPVPANEKIQFATSPGFPVNSYGFVRFQVTVK